MIGLLGLILLHSTNIERHRTLSLLPMRAWWGRPPEVRFLSL
jgi:hypothetical protein